MGSLFSFLNKSKINNWSQETYEQSEFSIVEEIHRSFDDEMSAILAEVSIKHDLLKAQSDIKIKCAQLLSLGFNNAPEVLEIKKLKEENELRIEENKKKEKILSGIKYFQQKYPLYKIITLDSLDKICEKYQLGYAAISNFTGVVPQKNLDVLLSSKIDDNDKALLSERRHRSEISERSKLYAYLELKFQKDSNKYIRENYDKKCYILSPLIIAAPPKDFTDEVKNYKLEKLKPGKNLKDPIVMQPVEYKDNIFMLIITAWGPEASDPEVVNQLMN